MEKTNWNWDGGKATERKLQYCFGEERVKL